MPFIVQSFEKKAPLISFKGQTVLLNNKSRYTLAKEPHSIRKEIYKKTKSDNYISLFVSVSINDDALMGITAHL